MPGLRFVRPLNYRGLNVLLAVAVEAPVGDGPRPTGVKMRTLIGAIPSIDALATVVRRAYMER